MLNNSTTKEKQTRTYLAVDQYGKKYKFTITSPKCVDKVLEMIRIVDTQKFSCKTVLH